VAGHDESESEFRDLIYDILDKANDLNDVRSINFPPISCSGIGFEEDKCAEIMIKTCERWLD
jgi:O-acetyl-ADP-ribose deacetylase (regulator of RNase III)